MNISKQAVLEIISGLKFAGAPIHLMDAQQLEDYLLPKINALPSISDGWISEREKLINLLTDAHEYIVNPAHGEVDGEKLLDAIDKTLKEFYSKTD